MGERKIKLSFLTLFLGSEAFLRCPRVRPVDCESCNTFSFKCKQQLNVRKECAQHCRLEDMKCPVDLIPKTCEACDKISLPCQDCRALSVPCRQSHKATCHAFCRE